MVNISCFNLAEPAIRRRDGSGYGREHGEAGFKEFVNAKSLMISEV